MHTRVAFGGQLAKTRATNVWSNIKLKLYYTKAASLDRKLAWCVSSNLDEMLPIALDFISFHSLDNHMRKIICRGPAWNELIGSLTISLISNPIEWDHSIAFHFDSFHFSLTRLSSRVISCVFQDPFIHSPDPRPTAYIWSHKLGSTTISIAFNSLLGWDEPPNWILFADVPWPWIGRPAWCKRKLQPPACKQESSLMTREQADVRVSHTKHQQRTTLRSDLEAPTCSDSRWSWSGHER